MLKKSQVSSDKKDLGFVWIIEGILSMLISVGIILILYLQISTKQRQGNGTMIFFGAQLDRGYTFSPFYSLDVGVHRCLLT